MHSDFSSNTGARIKAASTEGESAKRVKQRVPEDFRHVVISSASDQDKKGVHY